jgi:hypothetical protein
LQILPETAGSSGRIAIQNQERVEVAAVEGSLTVSTSKGVLLAKVLPGSALTFQPQVAGAAAPFSIEGCLASDSGRFLLNDVTANVGFELRGQNLGQFAGSRVRINAVEIKTADSAPGATRVLQVTKVERISGACPVPASAPGNANGRPRGATAGKSGATKAVVAGVAVAAAVGGMAVGLTGNEPTPSISR